MEKVPVVKSADYFFQKLMVFVLYMHTGVTANSLHPGLVRTDFVSRVPWHHWLRLTMSTALVFGKVRMVNYAMKCVLVRRCMQLVHAACS